MQLARGDANFRAKTIAITVGKSGRGVAEHSGRVDFVEESLSGNWIVSHDGLGMRRPVGMNVFDRVIDGVDHTNRQDEIRILAVPVVVFYTFDLMVREHRASSFASPQRDIPGPRQFRQTGK